MVFKIKSKLAVIYVWLAIEKQRNTHTKAQIFVTSLCFRDLSIKKKKIVKLNKKVNVFYFFCKFLSCEKVKLVLKVQKMLTPLPPPKKKINQIGTNVYQMK